VSGSSDVAINGFPALRDGDRGSTGSGADAWVARGGAARVLINGRLAFRIADTTRYSGEAGKLIGGSPNVLVGDRVAGAGHRPPRFVAPVGSVKLSALKKAGASITPWEGEAPLLAVKGTGSKLAVAIAIASCVIEIAAMIPAMAKLLHDVKTWATYAAASLFHWLLTGGWSAVDKTSCAPPSASPPSITGEVDVGFDEAMSESDVTDYTQELIEKFKPVIFQDPEDVHPISIEELLRRSVVRSYDSSVSVADHLDDVVLYHETLYAEAKPYGSGPKDGEDRPFYLDIDDDFARERGPGAGEAVVYARAVKQSKDHVKIQYAMIRPASYLPYPGDPYAFWEHEGDGEAAHVFVRRDSPDGPWYIRGVVCSAHAGNVVCCGKCVSLAPDGRPKVYVARGSHALAPTPDDRVAGAKVFIDTFDQTELDYDLRAPGPKSVEHQVVFTRRAAWGDPHAFNADGPLVFAHSYPGYDEHAEGQGDCDEGPDPDGDCKC
jgi:uncharacterized Zn-binding protein involved in type VI secretion